MINFFLAGLGVIAGLFVFETVAKNNNTKENRQNAVNLLNDHLNISGFQTLSGWLAVDGFISGTYSKPEDVGTNTKLTIGAGLGSTRIGYAESVDDFLRNLTAGLLNSIVNKAITYTPKADTPEDRQTVLEWLAIKKNAVKNFDMLYNNLTAVGWTTKHPDIPSTDNIPLTLLLGNKKRIYDYHKFLISSNTSQLLEVIDSLLYPSDPDIEAREIVYLTIGENLQIPGFQQFQNILTSSGFIKSPQEKNIPKLPETIIIGSNTYSNTQLKTILETASSQSIDTLITSILSSYDPTIKARTQAIALLLKNMNNYKCDINKTYQNVFLPDMYEWLKTSGFTSSPRKFSPVDTSKFKGTVYSYGWSKIDNMQDFLKTCTAGQVEDMAKTGSKNGVEYQKWLAVKTGQQLQIQNIITEDPQTQVAYWRTLENNGLFYNPPEFTSGAFVQVGVGCNGKAYTENEEMVYNTSSGQTNNLWDGTLSANYYCPNLFIGNDQLINPKGIFNKYMSNGTANPYYCEASLKMALQLSKSGQEILLPDS